MVLVLRTCGAYHPHHMCKAPAPNWRNINTPPTRFVIEPYFVNIQEHLLFIPFSHFFPKNYTQSLQKFFFKILFKKNYYVILSRNHYKRVDNLPSVSLIIFNITVSYWWSMKLNSLFQ